MIAPKTGYMILMGCDAGAIKRTLAWLHGAIGVGESELDYWQWMVHEADPKRIKLHYQPGKDYDRDWGKWFDEYQKMPPEDAASAWWERQTKDGHSLTQIIAWGVESGHRPIVGVHGELHHNLLDDPAGLEKYALFLKALIPRVYNVGGMAGILKFSTGTATPKRVRPFQDTGVLDFCRPHLHGGREKSVVVIDEYAAWYLSGWMGPNQTEGLRGEDGKVRPDVTEDEKWAAYLKVLKPDLADSEKWRPAWLARRVWGHRNDDGSFGIPALYDCRLMLGEVNASDDTGDDTVPRLTNGEGPRGWYLAKNQMVQRKYFANEIDYLLSSLRFIDDCYNRPRLPDGSLQVPWREWFGAGPGFQPEGKDPDWWNFDLFRTGDSERAYNETYAQEAIELPPAMVLPEAPPPVVIDTRPTNQEIINALYKVAGEMGMQGWALVELLGWQDLGTPSENREKKFDGAKLESKPEGVTDAQWAGVLTAIVELWPDAPPAPTPEPVPDTDQLNVLLAAMKTHRDSQVDALDKVIEALRSYRGALKAESIALSNYLAGIQ